jgi:hypothetical protein
MMLSTKSVDLSQNNWLYKLLGIEQQVSEWIAQLRTMTWDMLKAKIQSYANDYLHLDKTKWTVWDPSRGEYAFQVSFRLACLN